MVQAELELPKYSLMPYEKKFAIGELTTLLKARDVKIGARTVTAKIPPASIDKSYLLTYFRTLSVNGFRRTLMQSEVEGDGGRQATRYSTHGLHEYKGKFNPQTARYLIANLVQSDLPVLDPFCGSGTTLLEAAHLGHPAEGWDMNPFAVHLANTKIKTLGLNPNEIKKDLQLLISHVRAHRELPQNKDARLEYLSKWFRASELSFFEAVREKTASFTKTKDFFLTLCSDLLRDYSLQEPADLRIRRRHSPMPETSLEDAFVSRVQREVAKLTQFRATDFKKIGQQKAYLVDSRKGRETAHRFAGAITSPPYFVALPYIDTQRLSLVWLGLASPTDIRKLEASITGSREFQNSKERELQRSISTSKTFLNWPKQLKDSHKELVLRANSPSAGFRTQAMPDLFIRFFGDMAKTFASVHNVVQKNGKFALVVGQNSVGKGENTFPIQTPELMAQVAELEGWATQEIIPLDAYSRFSIHSKNAVRVEKLVVLRRK